MLLFEGKERGDLDLHFHQAIFPLSEGNLVDLDLGVLGVLLVLPLIFLHSFCCFGRDLRVWDLSTSCALAIALVHRFEFSPRIHCSK